jgi:hypothetical protein
MIYVVRVGDVEVSRYTMRDADLDPVWTRYAPTTQGKAGVWVHRSGVEVHHCGHPTATHPYVLISPDGRTLVAENGRGFRTAKDARAAVDAVWRGLGASQAQAHRPHEPQQLELPGEVGR